MLLLWFVCLLNYADRQAIFALFPLLKSSLRLSDVQLGLVGSSFMWMYALCGPVAGWLGDRWPRRWLITGGLVLWIALTFITSAARGFAELVSLRTLSGLGEALYFPAAMTLISSLHGPQTRSRAMSLHQSAVYAGSIAGGSVAGWIAQDRGWPASFVCFGFAGLVVLIPVLIFLRDTPASEEIGEQRIPQSGTLPFLQSARAALSISAVRRLILAFIGANFVAMVFMSWLPTYLHTQFHLSAGKAGLDATLFVYSASIVGVFAGGALADRYITRSEGGRIRVQASGLAFGVVFLLFTGWVHSLTLLLGCMVAFGFAKGIYDANIFASLHDLVPAPQRASASGLLNSLGWLGGGVAPVVTAMAAARIGMSACLSLTSLVYLGSSWLLFNTARRLDGYSSAKHVRG